MYTTENIKKGDKVKIYFNCDNKEKEILLIYINKYYSAEIEEIEDEFMDEFYIVATSDINLRSLYLYHTDLLK